MLQPCTRFGIADVARDVNFEAFMIVIGFDVQQKWSFIRCGPVADARTGYAEARGVTIQVGHPTVSKILRTKSRAYCYEQAEHLTN